MGIIFCKRRKRLNSIDVEPLEQMFIPTTPEPTTPDSCHRDTVSFLIRNRHNQPKVRSGTLKTLSFPTRRWLEFQIRRHVVLRWQHAKNNNPKHKCVFEAFCTVLLSWSGRNLRECSMMSATMSFGEDSSVEGPPIYGFHIESEGTFIQI